MMGVEGTKASYLGLGMPPLVSGGRADRHRRCGNPRGPQADGGLGRRRGGADAGARARFERARCWCTTARAVRPVGRLPAGRRDDHRLGRVRLGGGRRRLDPHLRHAARPRHRRLDRQPARRIFCNKLEAELIAIDGLYRTADDMDPEYRSRPVQAWLEGETMTMAALS